MKRLILVFFLISSSLFGDTNFTIPDVEVLDQEGRKRAFFSDLVEGQVVAINFIFTRCQSVCPVSGAYFGKTLELAKENPKHKVRFISISLDPANDTPEKLKEWAQRFGHDSNWSLVTGAPGRINELLKAFGAFTADKEDHAPLVLVGSEPQRKWKLVQGFTSPKTIWNQLSSLSPHPYLPNTSLVDHRGQKVSLYSDLIQDQVVVIHCFYSSCQTVCPMMLSNMKRLSAIVGDEIQVLSITLDPERDTSEYLRKYADVLDAGPNWHFLTGNTDEVDLTIGKLGFATDEIEKHSNILIIGNDKTGLWKKARGSASSEEITEIARSVVDDEL